MNTSLTYLTSDQIKMINLLIIRAINVGFFSFSDDDDDDSKSQELIMGERLKHTMTFTI